MASNHNTPQNDATLTLQTLERNANEDREQNSSHDSSPMQMLDQTSRYEQTRLDALTGGAPSTTWELG